MIYYKALVGSRSYGLAIEGSDTDLFIVSDEGQSSIHGGLHIIHYTPASCLNLVPLPQSNILPSHIQWLFAEEAEDTPLRTLVLEHREGLVSADRRRVCAAYLAKAEGLSHRLEAMYETQPKRGAYACMFFDVLCRYAGGASFLQATRPEEDFRQWLLAVRRREVDVRELAERTQALRDRAERVKGFYQDEPDKAYLDAVARQMRETLGIYETTS